MKPISNIDHKKVTSKITHESTSVAMFHFVSDLLSHVCFSLRATSVLETLFSESKTGRKGHLLKFSSKWKINKFLVSSCEHILYKVLWVLQAHLPSSKKWWQAISHVALCNETPWGREQCLLGNYTISQNSSQVRLFMKYIASETEESQNGILFTSKVIPARKQTCFQKKQMEYPKANPESRQVWSSGKTLLDLPWSNGNDQWPMAIFGHAQHTMVLHLCRAKCSLIQVFITCVLLLDAFIGLLMQKSEPSLLFEKRLVLFLLLSCQSERS